MKEGAADGRLPLQTRHLYLLYNVAPIVSMVCKVEVALPGDCFVDFCLFPVYVLGEGTGLTV